MDYEKKYNEAQKWIESIYSELSHEQQMEAEAFFPELKESEDEKIRKAMIDFFKHEREEGITVLHYGVNIESMIAWLEKQCEKKPIDKVEPKFKVGDWVVFNNKHQSIYQVEKIEDGYYILRHTHGGTFRVCVLHDESLRLWTIQDTKDGDVLVCIGKYGQEIGIIKEYVGKYGGCDKCFETYCFVDWDGIFRTGEYMGSKEIHPATKEQRDLLFKKMKEAGYEFDFAKKELNKIEQKLAWSEEDERKLQLLIVMCDETKGDSVTYSTMYREMEELKTWLKYLKGRVLPQPKQKWSDPKQFKDK